MTTPTFKAISGCYKISDIQVTSEAAGGGNEYGAKLNADGSWGQDYYYLNENAGVEPGWYKDSVGDEPVTDEDVLNPGEALSLSTENAMTLTFAGQVNADYTSITIDAGGFSMFGNATPVTVKISELVVEGADVGGGNEYGAKLNTDGSWGQDYYYLNENAGVEPGWYKDSVGDEPVTDEDVLEPGESLSISAENEFTIKIPSAIK